VSPTLSRPCPRCQTALITRPARYCRPCARAVSAARGTTTERGLGWSYQRKRARIIERDHGICWLCNQAGAETVDHVVPRARGGDDSDANLRAAHAACNMSRGARIVRAPKTHGRREPKTGPMLLRISHRSP